ncbi:hypothetical protein [Deinococcus marmoris]|uniref:Uncharacterized protein n=1 Tax=Deinococcus marmoris TaxID=249408 RepID=A0A1U7P1A9_9DEIO|nr:hypothetical protein [Deinococcus marmoris]OLV18949.1 hypothetical protein BOO71_0004252 [Deinococcus marmoris]
MYTTLAKALPEQRAFQGKYTLEVLRGKTSRIKLREHDAEALEGQRQADAEDVSNAQEALA